MSEQKPDGVDFALNSGLGVWRADEPPKDGTWILARLWDKPAPAGVLRFCTITWEWQDETGCGYGPFKFWMPLPPPPNTEAHATRSVRVERPVGREPRSMMGRMKQRQWVTRPISTTCEVMTSPDYLHMPCGRPTASAYPAMGGGWMALCLEHGAKHAEIATPITELLASGESLLPNASLSRGGAEGDDFGLKR